MVITSHLVCMPVLLPDAGRVKHPGPTLCSGLVTLYSMFNRRKPWHYVSCHPDVCKTRFQSFSARAQIVRCCPLSASGPLAVWVAANLQYSRVLKQIAPLEAQLNQLTGELTESQDRLKQCQAELMALDDQVGGAQALQLRHCA